MCQFDENCVIIDGVRVPHWKTSKEPLWRHTNGFLNILREYCTSECFDKYSPPTSNLVIEIVCSKDLAQKSYFNGFFRYFNGQLRNRRPRYGHIRHQRLQIYKNWRFVFEFAQIFILTGFPFFRRPFWLENISRYRWFAIPYKAFSWR